MSAQKGQCGKCGAEVAYESGRQSLKCTYCGQVTDIAKPEDALPGDFQTIVPLTVNPDEVRRAIHAYVAADDDAPDDMLSMMQITKVERLYVPAYLFHGDYVATWTASFGYDRTETYNVVEQKYDISAGKFQPTAVTKTRVVTDWRPVNGEATGAYAFPVYAGKLLNSPGVVSLVEEQDLEGATDFNESFAAGLQIEPFVAASKLIFDTRGKAVLGSVVEAGVKRHAQGDQQRDWHWNPKVNAESAPMLLPICHAVFEYEGKTYDFWTSGTDVSSTRADSLPKGSRVSHIDHRGWWALAAALAGMVIGPLVVGHTHPLAIVALPIAVIFAILASSASSSNEKTVRQHSRSVRQATLTRLNAESSSGDDLSDAERQRVVGSLGTIEQPKLKDTQKFRKYLPFVAAAVFALGFIPDFSAPASAEGEDAAQAPAELQAPPSAAPTEAMPLVVAPESMTQPGDPAIEEPADASENPVPDQSLDPGQVQERIAANFIAATQCLRRGDRPCADRLYADVLVFEPGNEAALRATNCLQSGRNPASCDPGNGPTVREAPPVPTDSADSAYNGAQDQGETAQESSSMSDSSASSATTPDSEYERRRSECPGGFLGKSCRHEIREQVCAGFWSKTPEAGASNCKR